jgi:hypothetical protein
LTGKSWRLRWFNQVNPRISKCPISDEEEERLMEAHRFYDNNWAMAMVTETKRWREREREGRKERGGPRMSGPVTVE